MAPASQAAMGLRTTGMTLFLSTFVNKVDKKGRVSVPAPFRAILTASQPFGGIACFRAAAGIIEASGVDRMQKYSDELDSLDETSDRYLELSAILADVKQLPWDAEGRIVLPPEFATHIGATDEVAFIGQGKFFLIREPGAAKREVEQAITARRRGAPGARP
jgi:MraZ protein